MLVQQRNVGSRLPVPKRCYVANGSGSSITWSHGNRPSDSGALSRRLRRWVAATKSEPGWNGRTPRSKHWIHCVPTYRRSPIWRSSWNRTSPGRPPGRSLLRTGGAEKFSLRLSLFGFRGGIGMSAQKQLLSPDQLVGGGLHRREFLCTIP